MTATDHHRPDVDELVEQLPGKGSFGHAGDSVSDALMECEDVLYGDEHTATAAEAVEFLDAAIRALHVFRDAAVTEHRRRTDAAMARSAELLNGGQE